MAASINTAHELSGMTGRQTPDGWEFTRTIVVVDVTGSGERQLVNATRVSGVPTLGAPLSAVPSCSLREIAPVPISSGKFRLVLKYLDHEELDDPSSQSVEVGGALQATTTNWDYDDNDIIWVQYNDDLINIEAPVDRPRNTIRVSRTEAESPGAKARAFVGTVNTEGGFNFAETGARAETWRCNSITGRSNDGGATYQVSYEFEYATAYRSAADGLVYGGWRPEFFYTNPEGNIPAPILAAGATLALKTAAGTNPQVYVMADFNTLRLT